MTWYDPALAAAATKRRVRFTVELLVDLPAGLSAADVKAHYEDGTWCANNLADMITEIDESGAPCLCGKVTAELVGEAKP